MEVWNELKQKLLLCQPFLKNKELIIEAVELHMLQSSSFTSTHSDTRFSKKQDMQHRKDFLIRQLEEMETRSNIPEEEKNLTRSQITDLEIAIKDLDTSLESFKNQKAKNQQRVQDCKKLLTEIKED